MAALPGIWGGSERCCFCGARSDHGPCLTNILVTAEVALSRHHSSCVAPGGAEDRLWESGHRDRFGYLPWSRRQSWALSRPGRVGRRITGRERLVRRLILPLPGPARFVAHMLRPRRPEVTVATLRFPRLLIAEGNKPAGGRRGAGLNGNGPAHSTQRPPRVDPKRRPE